MAATNQDLKAILNQLYLRPQPPPTKKAGKPGKSGQQQIEDNAEDLVDKATVVENVAARYLGVGDCLESTASVDGRGRPVRSMRVRITNGGAEIKREFRAYHVTWVAANGQIPDSLRQYSHRCHNGKCIQEMHGTWDTDQENKARNACHNHSHLQLPNGAFIQLCPHNPPCLSAAEAIQTWQDPRVVLPPLPPSSPPLPPSPLLPSLCASPALGLSSPPPSPSSRVFSTLTEDYEMELENALY